jgi:hypothetical protein
MVSMVFLSSYCKFLIGTDNQCCTACCPCSRCQHELHMLVFTASLMRVSYQYSILYSSIPWIGSRYPVPPFPPPYSLTSLCWVNLMQKTIIGRNEPKSEVVENLFTSVARCVICWIVSVLVREASWITLICGCGTAYLLWYTRCDMLADRTGAAALRKKMHWITGR